MTNSTITHLPSPEGGSRMEWLDAMRGFTMILVVAYHVAQFGFGESEKTSVSLPFLVLFRMPLFFFVSGFLAYKSRWAWTAASYGSLIWKKVKVQEQTFRELFLRQLYLLHTKIKICLHL